MEGDQTRQQQPYQYQQYPPGAGPWQPGYNGGVPPQADTSSPAYLQGYQAAVRDLRQGGGSMAGQALLAVVNAGIFLGLPLYLLYRINRNAATGRGSNDIMSQMMERLNPIPKRNFEVGVKNTKFTDVIGIPEAKEEVMEYIDFLRNPHAFQALGARLPRGALLTGKPGTGKTLLAKAVAGEAGVKFYSACGADFIEIFGGSGPKRVRELFQEAKKNAPAVIFIDELDAVGSKRSSAGDQGIGGEENRTTNALLAEMDGMETNDQVVVFAATNHPEALDTALTRNGRFDRKIDIPVPDEEARKELFEFYLQKIVTALNFKEKSEELRKKREAQKEKMAGKKDLPETKMKEAQLEKMEKKLESMEKEGNESGAALLRSKVALLKKELCKDEVQEPVACTIPPNDEDLKEATGLVASLAARTPGVTPATIAAVCNEAAIVAARQKSSFVKPSHLQDALDNVLIGKKHRQRMSPEALKRVAYHEAGHTVAQWVLRTTTPVIKVSIIPRGRAGGYTQSKQQEELDPKTDKHLFENMVVLLGGRCAELEFFGDLTTGAHDDLQRAFELAQTQVSSFGMSSLGHIALNPQAETRGRAFSRVSDTFQHAMDEEARKLVQKAYDDCRKLIGDNRKKVEDVAKRLLEKKEVLEEEIVELLGPKPTALARAA